MPIAIEPGEAPFAGLAQLHAAALVVQAWLDSAEDTPREPDVH